MYLSQLILDVRSRRVLRDMADPHEMHKTLTTCCFATEYIAAQKDTPRAQSATVGAPGLLFRLDIDRKTNYPVVLIQSHVPPKWAGLPAGYAVRIEGPKEFNLTGRLRAGQHYEFRLRANPTKRGNNGGKQARLNSGADGERRPIYGQQAQIDWLVRKSTFAGFTLLSHLEEREGEQVRVYDVDAYDEGNERGPLTASTRLAKSTYAQWVSVIFRGVLEVTDPQKLLAAIESGIGTAKGMGFGLLSLAPVPLS